MKPSPNTLAELHLSRGFTQSSHRTAQVQVRKWIRNVEALERALPTTKCIVPHARHNGAASEMPKSPAWETGVALPTSLSRPSAVAFEATPANYEPLCSLAIQVAKPISAYGPLPQRTPCSSVSLPRNSMALQNGSKEDVKTVSGLFFPHASAYDAMRRTVMATPTVRGSSEEPAPTGQGAHHHVQRSEHAVAMELLHMSCFATPAAS